MRRIRPSRKKPTERLSGDQNGMRRSLGPWQRPATSTASSGRNQSRAMPPPSVATKTSCGAVGREHGAAAAGGPDDAAGHAEAAGGGRRDEKSHDARRQRRRQQNGNRRPQQGSRSRATTRRRSTRRVGVATSRRCGAVESAPRRLVERRAATSAMSRKPPLADPLPGTARTTRRTVERRAARERRSNPDRSSGRAPACRTPRRRRTRVGP